MIKLLQRLVNYLWEDIPVFKLKDRDTGYEVGGLKLKRYFFWIIWTLLIIAITLKHWPK